MTSTQLPDDLLTIDMSPAAVDRRLRTVAQLYRLGMALRDVLWLGPVESASVAKVVQTPVLGR